MSIPKEEGREVPGVPTCRWEKAEGRGEGGSLLSSCVCRLFWQEAGV